MFTEIQRQNKPEVGKMMKRKQIKKPEMAPKKRVIRSNNDVIHRRVDTHLAALEQYLNIHDSTLFDDLERKMHTFMKKVRLGRRYWRQERLSRLYNTEAEKDFLERQAASA